MTSVCQVSVYLHYSKNIQPSDCKLHTPIMHILGMCFYKRAQVLHPPVVIVLLFIFIFLHCCSYHGTCSVSVVPKATVNYTNAVCAHHPRIFFLKIKLYPVFCLPPCSPS